MLFSEIVFVLGFAISLVQLVRLFCTMCVELPSGGLRTLTPDQEDWFTVPTALLTLCLWTTVLAWIGHVMFGTVGIVVMVAAAWASIVLLAKYGDRLMT